LTRYFSHLTPPESSDTLKDSKFKAVLLGHVLPCCLLAVVAANFWLGKVFVPVGKVFEGHKGNVVRGLIQSYPFGRKFAGVVTVKMALAVALFAWYGLANKERTERYAHPALAVAIGGFVVGLAMYVAGFFV
jgi:uncharacterized membrane protein YedE/YeeE